MITFAKFFFNLIMLKAISSVLQLKCPKCREGDLFINKSSYKYKGFFEMPKNCSKCGQDFEIETGFYYGAMYVSYALTIAITVAIFTALTIFNQFTIGIFLICDVVALVLTMPYITRVSRAIWIALMIKFDPNAIENHERKTQS